jgi:hypothetical protein
MPSLQNLGKERVNSFTNDFTMHIVGPDLELGFAWRSAYVNLSANAGIVPIFYLSARQKTGIVPLMDPHYADHSQQTSGSPYLYADIGFIIWKYVSLAFLYDFSRLNYKVIDFDDNLQWYTPERKVTTQSLKIETSLLIPLGGDIYTQIGYGHTFDSTQLDSASPVKSSRQYLILTAKLVH